jgi:probable F420-dependent oxidoreductase
VTTDAMRVGVALFLTDETAAPDEVARAAEARGFESLWLPEHTHIPAQSSPAPGATDVPSRYARVLDPFVSLTAAACATSELRLGFGVCLLAQRDPIVTAKAVATINYLSRGRVLLAVGAGWNEAEMRSHGVTPSSRFRRLREHAEAVRAILTMPEASYHGRFVNFDRLRSWPKAGELPLLVGGGGPTVLERVLEYGDGWFAPGGMSDDELIARAAELRASTDRALEVTAAVGPRDPERIARIGAAGIDRCCFYLPSANLPTIERDMDAIVELVEAAGLRL